MYFFNIGNTLSIGNASTTCPSLPFVVTAASNELIMASSVASITAMNKGVTASFERSARIDTGCAGRLGMRTIRFQNAAQLKRLCRGFPNATETLYRDPYNFLVYSIGGRKFAYFKTSDP